MEVVPFHSLVSVEEQERVFAPQPDKPKVR
jgi:HrpA-like RNA helicase